MTVQTVVQEVCAVVGVRPPPGSIFLTPSQDRTMWEFVNLANEMVQRISYDVRDWTILRTLATLTGPGTVSADGRESTFPLPAGYQRLLKSASLYRSANPLKPMQFISDSDQWLYRAIQGFGFINPWGEWTIYGGQLHIRPPLAAAITGPPAMPAETVKFFYMRNTCVNLASGGVGTKFVADNDTWVLPDRLLRLGMIWQWKASKGGTYAEDIANYEDCLAMIAGSDKPGPIIVGGRAQTGTVGYPYPTPDAPETPYPISPDHP